MKKKRKTEDKDWVYKQMIKDMGKDELQEEAIYQYRKRNIWHLIGGSGIYFLVLTILVIALLFIQVGLYKEDASVLGSVLCEENDLGDIISTGHPIDINKDRDFIGLYCEKGDIHYRIGEERG